MCIHYFAGRASSIPKFKILRRGETGPWSNPITVVDFSQAPGLYAPYMNPLYVEDNGKTLYFTMSLWGSYDVYLAKVTLISVPEPPATIVVFGIALGGLGMASRRRVPQRL